MRGTVFLDRSSIEVMVHGCGSCGVFRWNLAVPSDAVGLVGNSSGLLIGSKKLIFAYPRIFLAT